MPSTSTSVTTQLPNGVAFFARNPLLKRALKQKDGATAALAQLLHHMGMEDETSAPLNHKDAAI